MSGFCMPRRKAATMVQPNDEKPPTRAAVRAGTTRAGRIRGSMFELIEATKIPSRPVIVVASTQLIAASRSGEKPSTTAPRSFSAAARGRQSEAGSLEHEPEHDGEGDDEQRHEELLLGQREDPEVDLILVDERQRLHRPRRQREAPDDDRLEHEQQADGGDDLGEHGGVAERPEDQPVDHQPEDDAEHQRQRQRRPERHRPAERDRARPVRQVEGVVGLEPVGDAFDERQRIGQRRHEEIALGAQPGVE